jgi:hypothetical protein
VAFHLGHGRSRDLDIFGPARASFSSFQQLAREDPKRVEVVRASEATLHLEIWRRPRRRRPVPLYAVGAPDTLSRPRTGEAITRNQQTPMAERFPSLAMTGRNPGRREPVACGAFSGPRGRSGSRVRCAGSGRGR